MFSPDRALEIARSFAYPRRSGSAGNRRAIEQISRFLSAADIQFDRHTFRPSRIPIITLRAALLCEAAALIYPAVWGLSQWQLSLLLFPLLVWIAASRLVHTCTVLPYDFTDENILTEALGEGSSELVIVAHHDSKSQPFSIIGRILAFTVMASCHAVLLAQGAIGMDPSLFLCGLGALDALALAALTYEDRSDGAIDNASGLGVALAAAEQLKRAPAGAVRIRFLLTGAEELGLQGAFSYLACAGGPRSVSVINIDSVGVGDRIWVYGKSGALKTDLVEAGERCGFRPIGAWMPIGLLADHVAFVRNGWRAVTLTTVSSKLRLIHTSADKAGVLERDSFEALECLLNAYLATRGDNQSIMRKRA